MKAMKTRIIISTIFIFLFASLSYGQKRAKKIVITGTVTNSLSQPVEGALIYIDSMRHEFPTDSRGFYRVRVPATTKTISAYSKTFGMGEAEIGSNRILDITVRPQEGKKIYFIEKEKEEMVDVGYGKINRRTSTASVSERDVQKPKYSSYNNIYDLIRSEFPSIRIDGSSIVLRGVSSYSGSNEALYVVDGIVVDRIDQVHPSDVKSISILTGSNAAVYGMRGANGVVMITTLRGDDRNK